MYQALYRVWRPKTFSDMVGQEAIVKTLRNQVSTGRIAHAYLFCGSRGTGKTSAAKIMARAINCLHPQNGDPCGECDSCRTIENDASFDVYEMDAASNSRVEEIRELLEKVDYPPQFGKYKVYIIDEVHMLSNAAFNALLKTLEEPPEYMVFILATTEPQKLPSTILSRCQRFDFGRFTETQIMEHLKKVLEKSGTEAEEEALRMIARAAEGGMRDALSILDMCMGAGEKITESHVRGALGTADRAFLFTFADALAHRDGGAAMRLTDQLMRDGRDVQVFLKDVSAHLRMLMAAKLCGADEKLLGSPENARRYADQAVLFSQERLLRALNLCMQAEADTRWAASARSVLEIFALKACAAPEENDLDALMERIAELENRIAEMERNGVRAAAPAPAPESPPAAPRTAEKAVPPPAETPVSEDGKTPKDIWNDTLKMLKKTEPGLFGPLSQGKYGGCREGVYRALFAPGTEFFVPLLSAPERREKIEAALNQCGAVSARFEAVAALAPRNPERERQTEKNLSGLIDMFGRDKVQIDE